MNRLYECVLIFDVQMPDDAREKIVAEIKTIITESGGTITDVTPFGIRKLTFEIKGRTRGDYRVVRFASGNDTLAKMDRLLRLKEEVVRFMLTKFIPPKPKKESKKRKKLELAKAEGEVVDGKSEQSVADGEHHAPAGA